MYLSLEIVFVSELIIYLKKSHVFLALRQVGYCESCFSRFFCKFVFIVYITFYFTWFGLDSVFCCLRIGFFWRPVCLPVYDSIFLCLKVFVNFQIVFGLVHLIKVHCLDLIFTIQKKCSKMKVQINFSQEFTFSWNTFLNKYFKCYQTKC